MVAFASVPISAIRLSRGPIEYTAPDARQTAVATRATGGPVAATADATTASSAAVVHTRAVAPRPTSGFFLLSRSRSTSDAELTRYPNARTQNATAIPRPTPIAFGPSFDDASTPARGSARK